MKLARIPFVVALAAVAGAAELHVPASPPGPGATAQLPPALLSRLAEGNGPVKVWVFFADKGRRTPAEVTAALQQVSETYNPRATQRRLLRGNAAKRAGQVFDEHDLSVWQPYIDAVTVTGARVHTTSRWLNAVSVWARRQQLEQIAALPFVERLQRVARARRVAPVEVRPAPEHEDRGNRLDYGAAEAQLAQINLIALHDAGYTGQGVIIGILDTGFHRTHDAFNYPAHPLVVVAEHDFINNDGNTDQEPNDPGDQDHHGTYILGVLGAYWPDYFVGGAFDASFILCKTEDTSSETPIEEDYYVGGLEFIEANAGDVATSSLGYIDWYTQEDLDGQTAVTTIAVNIATANGVHCCTAAGNEGHDIDPDASHLLAPADAFEVITCGAVNFINEPTDFTSDGPTADGRVKPEVMALGESTATVDPDVDYSLVWVSGTSLSTPLVAAAVACLTQAHPEWTVTQLRTFLFHTADYYRSLYTFDPLYIRGYGTVNAYAAAQDCNHNSVPDLDDLVFGGSTDVNGNGIPDECESVGDLNCDGVVDFGDINPFVLYLSQYAVWLATYPGCDPTNGDINGDGIYGAASFGDINPFVALLSGS